MVSFKAPSTQVIFVFLAVLCLAATAIFFLDEVYPLGNATFTLRWSSSKVGDELLLPNILEKAATPNKLVIITTLNEAWATPGSILDIFFDAFHIGIGTEPLLGNLLMATVDSKAHARCKAVHSHCFFLATAGVDFSQEKEFMTPDYLKLMWRRIDFLRTVLELGYDFVFTDLDIMWLRDPFPDLLSREQDGADITIACDQYNGNPDDVGNRVNGGFNYVRANNRTARFYRHWYESRESHPGLHDQDVFNIIKQDQFTNELGVKFRFLDTTYFSGFCELSKQPSELRTMHANCCIGLKNKIRGLRLVLGDWSNFVNVDHPKTDGRNVGSNVTWRFPTAKLC